jgi:alpha-1,6-mannosyltransferase
VLLTGTLRIDTHDISFVVSSLLLGVGLGVASVCAWRITNRAEKIERSLLLRWAMLAQVAVLVAAPLTSSDIFHYLAFGQLQLIGKNPFAVGSNALGPGPLLDLIPARWASFAAPYGPLTVLLLRGAANLGSFFPAPIFASAIAWKLMMLLCTFATFVLAGDYLEARARGSEGKRALAALLFSPLIAWEISGQAHNDGLLILSLMGFVAAASAGRELLAVIALAAGVYSKITIAPVLALYLAFTLRTRGWRAVLYAFLVVALGGALMIPFRAGFAGIGPSLASMRASARSHSLGDLLDIALTPFGRPAQDAAVSACFVLCIVACIAAFANGLRARSIGQLLRSALIFLLAWDLTVPLFQPWYVTWLFPLAIADEDPRWLRLVSIYAIGTVLQWTIQIDPLTTVALNVYVLVRALSLLRNPAGDSQQLPQASPL